VVEGGAFPPAVAREQNSDGPFTVKLTTGHVQVVVGIPEYQNPCAQAVHG
jgi:hypothetical protein